MTKTCEVKFSEFCFKCTDRICSKLNIATHILASGDERKINNLNKVLTLYDLKIPDYVQGAK